MNLVKYLKSLFNKNELKKNDVVETIVEEFKSKPKKATTKKKVEIKEITSIEEAPKKKTRKPKAK
jgi:hypothetical protein